MRKEPQEKKKGEREQCKKRSNLQLPFKGDLGEEDFLREKIHCHEL